jgi:hypothetical protein
VLLVAMAPNQQWRLGSRSHQDTDLVSWRVAMMATAVSDR